MTTAVERRRSTTRSATCRRTPPLVVTFDTDIDGDQFKNLDKLLRQVPVRRAGEEPDQAVARAVGHDYEKDVKPLLGNELVVGSPTRKSLDRRLGGGRVRRRVRGSRTAASCERADREGGRARRRPASIDGNDAVRVAGRLGRRRQGQHAGRRQRPRRLEAALERHDGDDKLTEDEFNARIRGPAGGPAGARLRRRRRRCSRPTPRPPTAREVKWVGGLRKFAVTGERRGRRPGARRARQHRGRRRGGPADRRGRPVAARSRASATTASAARPGAVAAVRSRPPPPTDPDGFKTTRPEGGGRQGARHRHRPGPDRPVHRRHDRRRRP